MASVPLNAVEQARISVEEYLRTSYRPDCDYVDGVVEERNLGEYEHSRVQLELAYLFRGREKEWSIKALPECRLQVRADRYRVPDLMVLRTSQRVDRIVREAPLLCVEVLSPEDTWGRMRARLNDYVAMGVRHIWCFDPEAREARRYDAGGFVVVDEAEMTVPGTEIRIVVGEVFSVLDGDAG